MEIAELDIALQATGQGCPGMSKPSDRFIWKKGDVGVTPGPARKADATASRKGKPKAKADKKK